MSHNDRFAFAVCQTGAEAALKEEVARHRPGFRFSYSRPGFVTFRVPESEDLKADLNLQSTFVRAQGICQGRVAGENSESLAQQAWEIWGSEETAPDHLHVFQRDTAVPGHQGFEPGSTALATEIGKTLQATCPTGSIPVNRRARAGQRILDCVVVQPGEWWLGYHQASTPSTRQPGGNFLLSLPEHAVSRAYLKMHEAILWSQIPLRQGDCCAEIGSSPGGACQALLDKGCRVIGIDPAEMHSDLLAHPQFMHIQKRASDMKRREFRGVRWLMADSNVAPTHTLDSVEAIVTHQEVHIRGMLLTLKLLKWELAAGLPEFLQRIRQWGFQHVRARQLCHNRQEVCVAAFRNRAMTRFGKVRKKVRSASDGGEDANSQEDAQNPTATES